jgi:Histidine kinase-, DNA gyrase B-, and HSP90-like ATPase
MANNKAGNRATKLSSEIERQRNSVKELGDQFTFPLFNSTKALESQRESGYRNSASAAREIVDNAIEAGANRIHIVMDRPRERKTYQRRDTVTAIAFIDDGSGMLPEMARYSLSWGGGTHFHDHEFIGKFGFGLPNASINQTRRVEVYTRISKGEAWTKAWLDIGEYSGEGSTQSIPEPKQANLPEFVTRYLERTKWELDRGTIVVWDQPDRLTYSTAASLKEHLLDDFGVTYRNLMKGVELVVEGVKVEVVDPLFLDPTGRFYRKPDDGGATLAYDEGPVVVKFTRDPETGERKLSPVAQQTDLEDSHLLAAGAIHVRVARFPLGFVVGAGGGPEPVDEFAKKRFEIRKSRRGMSFVRAGREIETVDVFPRRPSDAASGLGDWPLLQSYAYHWGIEVKFSPELDAVFGITNDKQTVRPVEAFWRLLAEEGIDALLHRENTWQVHTRAQHKTERRRATLVTKDGNPSPAEFAAQAADVAGGERPTVPDRSAGEANLAFEKKAQERAEVEKIPIEAARKALAEQQKKSKYLVEFGDDPHGPFYQPTWSGTQVVVRINQQHPFFEALYGTLLGIPGGSLAKEAVDLLLIALSREELKTKNPETAEFYRAQRTERWSPFLASSIRTLSREFQPGEEDEAAA